MRKSTTAATIRICSMIEYILQINTLCFIVGGEEVHHRRDDQDLMMGGRQQLVPSHLARATQLARTFTRSQQPNSTAKHPSAAHARRGPAAQGSCCWRGAAGAVTPGCSLRTFTSRSSNCFRISFHSGVPAGGDYNYQPALRSARAALYAQIVVQAAQPGTSAAATQALLRSKLPLLLCV